MEPTTDSDNYDFSQKERGIALLIHNEHFFKSSKYKDRHGDDIDYKHMKKIFKTLGFKICSFRDRTKKEMLNIARKVASDEDSHKDSDCFVCVVASHGEESQIDTNVHSQSHDREHVIIGVDGKEMKTSKFVEMFDDDHCEALKGKPKLFFIQACRIGKYRSKDEGMDKGTIVNVLQQQNRKNKRKSEKGQQTFDADETNIKPIDAHSVSSDNPLTSKSDESCQKDQPTGDSYSEDLSDRKQEEQPARKSDDSDSEDTDSGEITSDTDDDEEFTDLKAEFADTKCSNVEEVEQRLEINKGKKDVEELEAKGIQPETLYRETVPVPMVTVVTCPEDTLIMFASLSGNFAVRGCSTGGWLLNKLYYILKDYSKNLEKLSTVDFLEILTGVLNTMSHEMFKPATDSTAALFSGRFSPGCFTHCLTKSIYFTKKESKRKKFSIKGLFKK